MGLSSQFMMIFTPHLSGLAPRFAHKSAKKWPMSIQRPADRKGAVDGRLALIDHTADRQGISVIK